MDTYLPTLPTYLPYLPTYLHVYRHHDQPCGIAVFALVFSFFLSFFGGSCLASLLYSTLLYSTFPYLSRGPNYLGSHGYGHGMGNSASPHKVGGTTKAAKPLPYIVWARHLLVSRLRYFYRGKYCWLIGDSCEWAG